MSDSESKFMSVLSMIKRAKTDNEKFAALLIVSKHTKSEDLSLEQRNELLNAIGIQFPIRLLATAQNSPNEDGCNVAFAAIGSSILSLFCMDDKISDEILKAVPHLLKVAQFYSESEEPQEREIVNDCLNCIHAASQNDNCASKIVQVGGIKVLCTFGKKYENRATEIVIMLLRKLNQIWDDTDFQNMMQKLAHSIENEQSSEKFLACGYLFKIMTCATEPGHLKSYARSILLGVEDILCSKVNAEQRKPALMLASEVLRLFEVDWFITHCKNEKFIVILTRLACIESGLYLRNVSNGLILKSDEATLQLLLSCYAIAEYFCSAVAKFEQNESEVDDILTFEQIRLAQPALADLANSVFDHISNRISQNDENLPSECEVLCLRTSIRFLGSWLNIENNLISAQGIETLSLLTKIIKHLIVTDDIHLIKTLLPGIMLSADNTDAFKTLMKNGILLTLEGALCHIAAGHKSSPLDVEILTLLNLLLQTIINVCSSLSPLDLEQNSDDIRKLFKTACGILDMDLSLRSKAYVYALIPMFFNMPAIFQCSKSVFENIIAFLLSAYEVSKTDDSLALNSGYKEAWPEISSLWIMCGREIADCVQTNKTFKNWFQENGRKKCLTDIIAASQRNTEVKTVFLSLLEASKGSRHSLLRK